MAKSHTSLHLRVGIFVSAALAVFAVAVFVIGQERGMFESKTRLHTSFADVNGLVVGAPIRLAGLDVGRVTKLNFDASPARPEARVEFSIEDEYVSRVRADSFAYIDSKGLLGDKLINLTVGTPQAAPLKDGDYVRPRQGLSFESLAQELQGTARAIGRTAESASSAVDELATPELAANLQRLSASLANLLEHVENGPGLAHDLLYEPQLAAGAREAVESVSRTAARLDAIAARIERGPGSLHALVYDDPLSGAIASLRRAGDGVAETTDQLNRGDGLAAALLHDPSGKTLLKDLTDFSARLDRIAAHVERGDGTLGALLVDPSVYEDLKTVLGNIERNTVLKALIRMTIKQQDISRPALEAKPIPAE